ncbi:MAG: enoyl-CoA hydratase/isomerase family protein [Phycisphaeraceae bacterium]|nr:enoyl-CoA hydratase/isomerase family protein [Phycisphaeraceae bacterium]
MVRLDADGAIASITLDRPDRRNALTPDMLDEVPSLVRRAEQAARVIVLRGEGQVFCAGFDLSLCRDDPTGETMKSLLRGLSMAVRSLRRSRLPVVAAGHAAAIAGGCALLGGADFVITNDEARLGYPVLRLGVSPAVSAPFLRAGVGDAACRERLLDTGLISGGEAARIGLAWRSLARPEAVAPAAMELAERLAYKSAPALAATKAWLNEIDGTGAAHWPDRALDASLGLAGGAEERAMLPAAWGGGERG